jgi:hypothetical protein
MGSARTQARVILGSYTVAALPARPAGRVGRSGSPVMSGAGDLNGDEAEIGSETPLRETDFLYRRAGPALALLHTLFLHH